MLQVTFLMCVILHGVHQGLLCTSVHVCVCECEESGQYSVTQASHHGLINFPALALH